MGAIAQLSTTTLDVEPGRTAELSITVRNTGSVVDRFSFQAVGDGAAWVTFTPDTLSLFPEASGTVSATFAPPRDPTVVAGEVPFGIRIASGEDASGTIVEEGTLTVSAFSQVSAELVPKIARGRRSARVQLAVDNRSNCAYRAELVATDPAGELAVGFNPPSIDVAPGGAEFVRMTVRPHRTFWRGPTTTKPFRVTLKASPLTGPSAGGVVSGAAAGGSAPGGPAPGGAAATTASLSVPAPPPPGAKPALASAASPHPAEVNVDGTMLQDAILPKWILKALAALVVLAVLAAVLWFALLKPQIKSTANSAVAKQLAAAGVTSGTGSSGSGSSGSGSSGSGSSGSGSSGSGSSGSGSSGSSATTIPNSSVSASSGSGTAQTVNGTSQATGNGTQTVYTVPNGHELQITDLLVENSAGNTGTIALARNGTVMMEWALANFRDLDYHWIAPTIFAAGNKLQVIVGNCSANCSPGIYYAGNLVKSS